MSRNHKIHNNLGINTHPETGRRTLFVPLSRKMNSCSQMFEHVLGINTTTTSSFFFIGKNIHPGKLNLNTNQSALNFLSASNVRHA